MATLLDGMLEKRCHHHPTITYWDADADKRGALGIFELPVDLLDDGPRLLQLLQQRIRRGKARPHQTGDLRKHA